MKKVWLIMFLLFLSVIIPPSAIAIKDEAETEVLQNEKYFERIFGLKLDNIYWGEFHTHTTYSIDAFLQGIINWIIGGQMTFSPAQAYEYARDVQDLDFVSLSDHSEQPQPLAMPLNHIIKGLSIWESLHLINQEYNNEDPSKGKIFIIFPGYEYTNTHGVPFVMGSKKGYGHKNVVFKSIDSADLPARRHTASLNKVILNPIFYCRTVYNLWSKLEDYRPITPDSEGSALTIIHTPNFVGNAETLDKRGGSHDHRTDWKAMDSDFVRHVEIYSKWGSSEGPSPSGAKCIEEEELYRYDRGVGDPISIRNILYENWVLEGDEQFILGFVGGTDNHVGRPAAHDYYPGFMKYEGALTGIAAPDLNRTDLWSSLWKRHTIAATTSPYAKRYPLLMAVEVHDDHYLMGDHGNHNGNAKIRILGDPEIEKLELIVNGCLVEEISGNSMKEILDLEKEKRYFIYVRGMINEDNEERRVWTSPVYLE